jgi:glycerophosphoryl diester phosphodiesterase
MSSNLLIPIALALVDFTYSLIPRKTPPHDVLRECKIISHRGEHDNKSLRENTMEAFRIARDAGAWGLEMDIRWTKDLVPMVHHDADTSRVFGIQLKLCDVLFEDLRRQVPDVPTLEEFISEFGGTCHLMIEMKEEDFPQLKKQQVILAGLLAGLEPVKDYHFLSLNPKLFEMFDIEPKQACYPVALFNVNELSAIALERGYEGISGQFIMIMDAIKARHDAVGQITGTGFPTSKNALYRELNRGVEWVFTNHAVRLLRIIKSELK